MQTFALPATAWITLLALATYIWIIIKVSKARVKYSVKAPSMDGPLEFLSAQRVQTNTVEQMIVFLPSMWLCAFVWNDKAAAAGGAIWVIGRIMYALAYYDEPKKRTPGFAVSTFATLGLILACAVGLVLH